MTNSFHLDIRTRIILMIVINMICAMSGPMILGANTVVILSALIYLKLPVSKWIFELRMFFLLLLAIGISRSVSVPGMELYSLGPISISEEGVKSAGLFCWKLVLVTILGILFIQTSQTFEIKAGIQWFLAPIPGVNEKQIAILLSLMLRFLPSIIHEASEIRQSQISRCVENRINPYYRISRFVAPLMRKTFSSVDELSDAMESRNFSLDRTEANLSFTRIDSYALTATFCYLGLAIVFSRSLV